MLEQPLDFTGCSSIQFFNLPPSPNTVSEASRIYLPLNMQRLCDLQVLCHTTGHQVLPTDPLPRETEDFPRVGKYPKDEPLRTYLDYLQPF